MPYSLLYSYDVFPVGVFYIIAFYTFSYCNSDIISQFLFVLFAEINVKRASNLGPLNGCFQSQTGPFLTAEQQ